MSKPQRRGISAAMVAEETTAAPTIIVAVPAPEPERPPSLRKPKVLLVPLNFRIPETVRSEFEAIAERQGWSLRTTLERALAALRQDAAR